MQNDETLLALSILNPKSLERQKAVVSTVLREFIIRLENIQCKLRLVCSGVSYAFSTETINIKELHASIQF